MTTEITGLQNEALPFVSGILSELTLDLMGTEVEPDQQLGGLGLESISLVYLIAEVQQEFHLGSALVTALRTGVGAAMPQMTIAEFAAVVESVRAAESAR